MHRDIKPENLVFDDNGFLLLTDLGIAKLQRKDNAVLDTSGTPGYMSPEVITGQAHDLCSDYFAIGIMTYEFMFGKRPYPGKSRKEIKEQILAKEINVKPKEIPADWSTEAADFINGLLKRKSKNRLGKNGIVEIKEHAWLKNIPWISLYKKELIPPFIPKKGDNFDANYCNRSDHRNETMYMEVLGKINEENYFEDFYFNCNDPNREKYFHLDGDNFVFVNLHEQKPGKTHGRRSSVSNVSTNNLVINKFDTVSNDSQKGGNINRSNSLTNNKKIKLI